MPEGITADSGDRVWDGDARQATAVPEGAAIDGSDGVGFLCISYT